VNHFSHREPVVTKVTLGWELFVKISSSPTKVHENSANGLVADARSQAGGRVLRIKCPFFLFFFISKRTLANPTSTSQKKRWSPIKRQTRLPLSSKNHMKSINTLLVERRAFDCYEYRYSVYLLSCPWARQLARYLSVEADFCDKCQGHVKRETCGSIFIRKNKFTLKLQNSNFGSCVWEERELRLFEKGELSWEEDFDGSNTTLENIANELFPNLSSSLSIMSVMNWRRKRALDIFLLLKHPDRFWGPPSLLFSGYRMLFIWW
jgi:hypothetical protein